MNLKNEMVDRQTQTNIESGYASVRTIEHVNQMIQTDFQERERGRSVDNVASIPPRKLSFISKRRLSG